ncbi:Imm1 family immunity protein [Saccharopolyspora phatthalungensis]|uniref:Uncharacterized protein n=1 Tax=Saccharopolyspora phatthalungensis TaxID=664693 RepID=A0A840QJK3_9PSEU|nr:Imm1 family immunity protein [Saccharopolyspora phatthalungensis]MBB5159428.1 hypothetical protein [Saccharopolyspora phatthalungensis]
MTATIGAFRIGGEGVSSPRPTAMSPDARITLIDQQLDQRPTARSSVLILEIDREGDAFATIDRFRHLVDSPEDTSAPDLIEFMRVGVTGTVGAAEYLHWTLSTGEQTIYATYNTAPTAATVPPVLYDDCVPQFFPPETVIALDQVRQLMISFALHGTWPSAAFWGRRDQLVV